MAETNDERTINGWDDFDLNTDLLRGIYNYGFEKPSPIQISAIPKLILGKDTIGQAQSGSGKTATFTIGTLQRINIEERAVQAFILAPTHELVHQIATFVRKLGTMMDGLSVKTLLGGTSVAEDAEDLRANPPHVIVGCIGRTYDMINRRNIDMSKVKIFVLDEADEMLAQGGGSDQIYTILHQLPNGVQLALFSATIPDEILRITEKFMHDPVRITMKAEELNLECIQQYYMALRNDHAKYDALKMLFGHLTVSQCIIYANSVGRVVDLYRAMTEEGFSVCCLHSSMSKMEREQTLTSFRLGTFRVMISSNITARGIDIQQVSTVINFDIPRDAHTYLHRIGRSGRFGRKGMAINFVTQRDIVTMRNIESYYKSNISELPSDFSWNAR
jgi:translation initiation factor 4A